MFAYHMYPRVKSWSSFFQWISWLGESAVWIQISRGRDLWAPGIFHSSRLGRLCSLTNNSKWRPVPNHYVCKINTKGTWQCKPYLSMVLQLLLSQNQVSQIHYIERNIADAHLYPKNSMKCLAKNCMTPLASFMIFHLGGMNCHHA